jgi:hypothetical protein
MSSQFSHGNFRGFFKRVRIFRIDHFGWQQLGDTPYHSHSLPGNP